MTSSIKLIIFIFFNIYIWKYSCFISVFVYCCFGKRNKPIIKLFHKTAFLFGTIFLLIMFPYVVALIFKDTIPLVNIWDVWCVLLIHIYTLFVFDFLPSCHIFTHDFDFTLVLFYVFFRWCINNLSFLSLGPASKVPNFTHNGVV